MTFSPYPEPKKPRRPTPEEMYADKIMRGREHARREAEALRKLRERGEKTPSEIRDMSEEERAEYEAGLERRAQARRQREHVTSPGYERQLDEMARTLKQIERINYLNEKRFRLMYSKDIDDVFSEEISPAKAAAHDAATAIREYRQHKADANADETLSATGVGDRVEMARNIAATKLDLAFGNAREGIEKINGAIADILKPEENDLEAEIKEQRAWNRYKGLLDAGHDPLQVVESASSDPVALRAFAPICPHI